MDIDAVHACQLLATKPNKGFLKVHKVIDLCHAGSDWGYGILAEKLTTLDQNNGYKWAQGINFLKRKNFLGSKLPINSILVAHMKDYIKQNKNSDDKIQKIAASYFDFMLPWIEQWAKWFEKGGIKWVTLHMDRTMG